MNPSTSSGLIRLQIFFKNLSLSLNPSTSSGLIRLQIFFKNLSLIECPFDSVALQAPSLRASFCAKNWLREAISKGLKNKGLLRPFVLSNDIFAQQRQRGPHKKQTLALLDEKNKGSNWFQWRGRWDSNPRSLDRQSRDLNRANRRPRNIKLKTKITNFP